VGSLFLQLQSECLDPRVAISNVLRKALVVARKLGVKDFLTRIENELTGYTDPEAIPSYRRSHGGRFAKVLNEIIRELKQSIPALELGSTEDAQMIADIQGIESQLESPRPTKP